MVVHAPELFCPPSDRTKNHSISSAQPRDSRATNHDSPLEEENEEEEEQYTPEDLRVPTDGTWMDADHAASHEEDDLGFGFESFESWEAQEPSEPMTQTTLEPQTTFPFLAQALRRRKRKRARDSHHHHKNPPAQEPDATHDRDQEQEQEQTDEPKRANPQDIPELNDERLSHRTHQQEVPWPTDEAHAKDDSLEVIGPRAQSVNLEAVDEPTDDILLWDATKGTWMPAECNNNMEANDSNKDNDNENATEGTWMPVESNKMEANDSNSNNNNENDNQDQSQPLQAPSPPTTNELETARSSRTPGREPVGLVWDEWTREWVTDIRTNGPFDTGNDSQTRALEKTREQQPLVDRLPTRGQEPKGLVWDEIERHWTMEIEGEPVAVSPSGPPPTFMHQQIALDKRNKPRETDGRPRTWLGNCPLPSNPPRTCTKATEPVLPKEGIPASNSKHGNLAHPGMIQTGTATVNSRDGNHGHTGMTQPGTKSAASSRDGTIGHPGMTQADAESQKTVTNSRNGNLGHPGMIQTHTESQKAVAAEQPAKEIPGDVQYAETVDFNTLRSIVVGKTVRPDPKATNHHTEMDKTVCDHMGTSNRSNHGNDLIAHKQPIDRPSTTRLENSQSGWMVKESEKRRQTPPSHADSNKTAETKASKPSPQNSLKATTAKKKYYRLEVKIVDKSQNSTRLNYGVKKSVKKPPHMTSETSRPEAQESPPKKKLKQNNEGKSVQMGQGLHKHPPLTVDVNDTGYKQTFDQSQASRVYQSQGQLRVKKQVKRKRSSPSNDSGGTKETLPRGPLQKKSLKEKNGGLPLRMVGGLYKRPAGRTPIGKVWDPKNGCWTDLCQEERIAVSKGCNLLRNEERPPQLHIPPPGRTPVGKVWDPRKGKFLAVGKSGPSITAGDKSSKDKEGKRPVYKVARLHKRPPGPAPAGKVWNSHHGRWIDDWFLEEPEDEKDSTKDHGTKPTGAVGYKRPQGRPPKGKVWDERKGVWIDDTQPSGVSRKDKGPYSCPLGRRPRGKVWDTHKGKWVQAEIDKKVSPDTDEPTPC